MRRGFWIFCHIAGLLGCSSAPTPPDFKALYDAQAMRALDKNPVIIIPGALGSTLVDADSGRVVWGAFGGSAADPQEPDGARLMALPMKVGAPLSSLEDRVYAKDVLRTASVELFGLRFQVHPYLQILRTLGVGGYRDQSLGEAGVVDYGEAHYTCFQFPYDWRRDVAENAAQLHRFILEKRAYIQRQRARLGQPNHAPIRFDLVTHSAGSMIARYYLRFGPEDIGEGPAKVTWAGAPYIERLIMIAPPNAGSVQTLVRLAQDGMKLPPVLPSYPPALSGTQPFIYQLLPRGRHGALRMGGPKARYIKDIFDPKLWIRMKWGLANPSQDSVLQMLLPKVSSAPARRAIALEHLSKSLRRAKRITAALDAPTKPPPSVALYAFCGDAKKTEAEATVDPRTGKLRISRWAPGDGTVTRRSVLLDERRPGQEDRRLRSPIGWRQIYFLFSEHLNMTEDPVFTDNVLHLLLESPSLAAPR